MGDGSSGFRSTSPSSDAPGLGVSWFDDLAKGTGVAASLPGPLRRSLALATLDRAADEATRLRAAAEDAACARKEAELRERRATEAARKAKAAKVAAELAEQEARNSRRMSALALRWLIIIVAAIVMVTSWVGFFGIEVAAILVYGNHKSRMSPQERSVWSWLAAPFSDARWER